MIFAYHEIGSPYFAGDFEIAVPEVKSLPQLSVKRLNAIRISIVMLTAKYRSPSSLVISPLLLSVIPFKRSEFEALLNSLQIA